MKKLIISAFIMASAIVTVNAQGVWLNQGINGASDVSNSATIKQVGGSGFVVNEQFGTNGIATISQIAGSAAAANNTISASQQGSANILNIDQSNATNGIVLLEQINSTGNAGGNLGGQHATITQTGDANKIEAHTATNQTVGTTYSSNDLAITQNGNNGTITVWQVANVVRENAVIEQTLGSNYGIVYLSQMGTGNDARIKQDVGNFNNVSLFQTNSDPTKNGNFANVYQKGNNNIMFANVNGYGNNLITSQTGDNNMIKMTTTSASTDWAAGAITGNNNNVTITQNGNNLAYALNVTGSNLTINVTQP